MKANWSLVLNVFLLAGVVYSIVRLISMRKKASEFSSVIQSASNIDLSERTDDIISVRKIVNDDDLEGIAIINPNASKANDESFSKKNNSEFILKNNLNQDTKVFSSAEAEEPLMMFLSAKEGQQLAGYELLQAILASGLRFGEGDLFHRHQNASGQGTIMCSLAAATSKGTFDLQNIGAFSVRGLCLYMYLSGNPCIDEERFDIMFDTAKSLSEDLDADLLDDRKKPISDASISRYNTRIDSCVAC